MQATRSTIDWPPMLAAAAENRAERTNWGNTAIWRYAPTSQSRGLLLMVHGFRGDHHGLEAIVGALPQYEIWVPDLPGYGKSEAFQSRHNLDSYSDWLLSLIDWLQPDGLVGHSFGTQIISRKSEQLPESLKVVLINPIVRSSMAQHDFANRIARSCYRLAGRLGKVGASALRSWFLVRVMSIAMCKARNPRLRGWIHGQHHKYFSGYKCDRVAHEGFWAAAMANVAEEWSGKTALKIAIIAGELDSIAPVSQVSQFADSISAKLTVLPRSGHLVHYEAPDRVAKAIHEAIG